ncbi:IS1 family transposase [Riemerella anatipestifer]|uniref:IS1 family transposase n=1 Tax=Riemerella anatipestifer TaxID=34085 RepID=UPI0013752A57|nr:IS1 family transposase [Riemerella anatipestifer]MDY3521491.1 IS1 family transposase [Riemerella anatipestifer]MDY3533633.1 IS1 family transposase [Riemerella anatipestifer]MDY3536038.1 IS1 family transposase [Riemerella anatipestifer]
MIIEVENYRQDNCLQCSQKGIKHGMSSIGTQRLYCKFCKKTWQISYAYKAYNHKINSLIILLTKEGCGIRSIARLLSISTTTLLSRIKSIAQSLKFPTLPLHKIYQIDELCTFVKNKQNRVWIICALEEGSKKIVRFFVGNRTNKTIKRVIDDVLVSSPTLIRTDKLKNYQFLIPKEIHNTACKGIQNIERMNLSLRTHLKRLNRKTIAYSRDITLLYAIVKIYLLK